MPSALPIASTPPTRCRRHSPLSLGGFITQTWLPRKRAHVRATTAHRYSWIVSHYVLPRLGDVPLRSLRSEHLDDLYEHLLARGGHAGGRLAPKTVHEAHLVVRNALDLAVHRQLVDRNVALSVHSPRRRGGGTTVARVWNAEELRTLSSHARPISGSIPPCISPRTPECGAANSSDSNGPTSTPQLNEYRSAGRSSASPDDPSSSGPRHEQVVAASTSTTPPSRCSSDGVAD